MSNNTRSVGANAVDALDEIDLSKVWHVIKAVKKWLLVAFIVMLGVGFIVSRIISPQYQTNAILQVKSDGGLGSQMSNVAQLMSSFSGMSMGQPNPTDVETALLSSRYVLGPVIKKLHLDIDIKPVRFPVIGNIVANHFDENHVSGLNAVWMGWNSYTWGGEQLKIDVMKLSPVLALSGTQKRFTLVVLPHQRFALKDDDGRVLLQGPVGKKLTSGGRDPLVTIKVASLIAHPGARFYVKKYSMEEQVKRINRQLSIASGTNISATANTGLLTLTYNDTDPARGVSILNAIISTASELSAKGQAEHAQRTLAFLKLQLPTIKKQLTSAESRLGDYQSKSGSFSLDLEAKALLQQVGTINTQLDALKLKRTELLQNYTPSHPFILTLDKKIAEVQKDLDRWQARIHQLPLQDKAAVELMRDVKIKSQLYLMLLGRIQELKIVSAGINSHVEILNSASEPPLKMPSHALAMVLGCGLLGLLGVIGYAVIKDIILSASEDPKKIERALGVPVEAMLPFSQSESKGVILAKENGRDMAIEALRSLRTSLCLAMLDARNNIVSITGLIPGVGKSFVSLNFAHVMADAGKRVLLIDTDLRKGRLHRSFQQEATPGLSDYLAGRASIEEIVRTMDEGHLYFISKGTHTEKTSELMMGSKFQELLDALALHYDMVLLDTAPILVVADGIVANQHAGVVYMVVASGENSLREVTRGAEILKNNQITLHAGILNYQKSTRNSYSYYNTDAKYYAAYSENDESA